eukprot:m.422251 g.422251  ORF g.422251 m.422251 type:complete len:56 (-) comp21328_c0_seq4:1024-1191(-)
MYSLSAFSIPPALFPSMECSYRRAWQVHIEKTMETIAVVCARTDGIFVVTGYFCQ